MLGYRIKKGHRNEGRIWTKHPITKLWNISATSTEPTIYMGVTDKYVEDQEAMVYFEHVEIRELKWIHPHLLKPIKEQLKKELENV